MTSNPYPIHLYEEDYIYDDQSSLSQLIALSMAPQINQNNKRKSIEQRFTKQEDKEILKLVLQMGPNFNKIVKYFPGKTMNMIKNRYYKKLRYQKEELQSDQDDNPRNTKIKKIH